MIDDGDWPQDPLSGQHDPLGHDGLAADPHGPVWHDGLPPDDLPAGVGDTSVDHGYAAAPGDVGDGDATPARPRPDLGPHSPAGIHPDPAVDPTAPGGDAVDLFGGAPEVEMSPFPARLELDLSPSDGRDWVDVDLLGGPGAEFPAALRFDPPDDLLADLHRLDGGEGAPSWRAVSESDDPVVRALGLRWRRA